MREYLGADFDASVQWQTEYDALSGDIMFRLIVAGTSAAVVFKMNNRWSADHFIDNLPPRDGSLESFEAMLERTETYAVRQLALNRQVAERRSTPYNIAIVRERSG